MNDPGRGRGDAAGAEQTDDVAVRASPAAFDMPVRRGGPAAPGRGREGAARADEDWSAAAPSAAAPNGWRLVALDLDGTLLGPDGRVGADDAVAVRRARDAGLEIVLATGRGLVESSVAVDVLPHRGLLVAASGAMLTDVGAGGRTLHAESMPADLVRDVSRAIIAARHKVLLLKDPDQTGYDYLAVGPHDMDPASTWWFETLPVRVRFVEHVEDDPHPHATVRVGAVAREDELAPIAEHLRGVVGDRAWLHHWGAVTSSHATGSPTHLLEVFGPGVDKWTMLERICRQRGVDASHVVAIGDGLNDVGMVRGAGLGVAMGNADPRVVAVADRTTEDHASSGVAAAIDRVLDGTW